LKFYETSVIGFLTQSIVQKSSIISTKNSKFEPHQSPKWHVTTKWLLGSQDMAGCLSKVSVTLSFNKKQLLIHWVLQACIQQSGSQSIRNWLKVNKGKYSKTYINWLASFFWLWRTTLIFNLRLKCSKKKHSKSNRNLDHKSCTTIAKKNLTDFSCLRFIVIFGTRIEYSSSYLIPEVNINYRVGMILEHLPIPTWKIHN